MATARDIVQRAFDRLFPEQGEALSPADATHFLNALNDMMHGWRTKSVDTNHTTLALGDTFPLDDKHIEGTHALLAVRVASDYEEPIKTQLAEDARRGWTGIVADYWLLDPMRVDNAALRLPSQRRSDTV